MTTPCPLYSTFWKDGDIHNNYISNFWTKKKRRHSYVPLKFLYYESSFCCDRDEDFIRSGRLYIPHTKVDRWFLGKEGRQSHRRCSRRLLGEPRRKSHVQAVRSFFEGKKGAPSRAWIMILEEEKHIRLSLSFFSEGGSMNVRVEELCCVIFKSESGCIHFSKCGGCRHAPSCSECMSYLCVSI